MLWRKLVQQTSRFSTMSKMTIDKAGTIVITPPEPATGVVRVHLRLPLLSGAD